MLGSRRNTVLACLALCCGLFIWSSSRWTASREKTRQDNRVGATEMHVLETKLERTMTFVRELRSSLREAQRAQQRAGGAGARGRGRGTGRGKAMGRARRDSRLAGELEGQLAQWGGSIGGSGLGAASRADTARAMPGPLGGGGAKRLGGGGKGGSGGKGGGRGSGADDEWLPIAARLARRQRDVAAASSEVARAISRAVVREVEADERNMAHAMGVAISEEAQHEAETEERGAMAAAARSVSREAVRQRAIA